MDRAEMSRRLHAHAEPWDMIVAGGGATGSWHGRTCSEPVRFIAVESHAPLSREQENAVDRQSARFGLLAGDPQLLDKLGHKMVAADPGSVDGHMYLGEASFRRQWAEALQEFTTARAEFDRRNPKAPEPPRFLDARIGQVVQRRSR